MTPDASQQYIKCIALSHLQFLGCKNKPCLLPQALKARAKQSISGRIVAIGKANV
jgi:hypothetical protein